MSNSDDVLEIVELEGENRRLRQWVSDLQSGMFINCVYCGHRYGPAANTPATMADVLRKHVESCPEHPMSKLRESIHEKLSQVTCCRCGKAKGFDLGTVGGTCRGCGWSSNMKSIPLNGNERIVRVGVAVFVLRGDRLLLGQRLGPHGGGTYSLPGGHVEYWEEPIDAAVQEVEEETGMAVIEIQPDTVRPWVNTRFPESGKQYVTLFFRAECAGEPQRMEPDKCGGWDWYELHRLPRPLFAALEGALK